jgi:hypothetical protein
LSSSAAGVLVTDATRPGSTVRVGNLTSGGSIALLVSRDCDRGSDVVFPGDAAAVSGTAASKDRRTSALVIIPHRADFTIAVTHPGAQGSNVVVSLGAHFAG